ncbi:hypothetical protein CRG98_030332 [Punica granatum]|uniref:Uncharacterized protein n=1 Tax=Punica granatum TaxID=22663 RepID=A0A2I0IZ64_PUNGR|nr:hypothetical protein CRG98_030332 [Punica granatum]
MKKRLYGRLLWSFDARSVALDSQLSEDHVYSDFMRIGHVDFPERCKETREWSGDPGTRKPVLLHLDNRGEVACFCRLFAPLRDVPLVSACFVLWAERFTRQPQLEIDNRRRFISLALEVPSVRTRILISSGHACAKPTQRGLGVSTFPWGCATDTREKESPLTVYDP